MKTVDICTYTYRSEMLWEVLHSLDAQVIGENIALRVIVADNDVTPSARFAVAKAAKDMRWPVLYVHAPARNISTARNACLDQATADWVACLDSDQIAPRNWITALLAEAGTCDADVVFAPSEADYPSDAPQWMVAGDVHSNRPGWGQKIVAHSSNVLLRWFGTDWQELRFDEAQGCRGGEDAAFFAQVQKCGARFAATSRAAVSEKIPPARLSLKWLAKRRFREGLAYFDMALHGAGWRPVLGAFAKMSGCLLVSLTFLPVPRISLLWALRGIRQTGVLVGRFSTRRPVW